MNLVLMGTNAFVVPMFDRIADEHNIIAVFTRAPKPVGRKQVLTKSPVHMWAEKRGFNVCNSIKQYNFKPDMIVVISYGVILGENVLDSAPCINIHPSILPKYRGASPIRTALLNGDSEIGVSLMKITSELDAGDIYMCETIPLLANDTNETVEQKVSVLGAEMLSKYLANPNVYVPQPQIGTPSFTRKYTTNDTEINWNDNIHKIHNIIRALGAGHTKINGIEVKILQTEICDNKLKILQLQPAGKKVMDWKSFQNGLHGQDIRYGE